MARAEESGEEERKECQNLHFTRSVESPLSAGCRRLIPGEIQGIADFEFDYDPRCSGR